jgi:hypothetical protein
MTRRNAILCCDIIVSLIVVEWSLLGPWDKLLGFDVYHSRGDVWLPTPPAAAAFFRGMVSTGTMVFAVFFLIASVLIFFLGRSRSASVDEKSGTTLERMFYGDARKLAVKYAVFLLISLISPFFYNWMWRFHVTRPMRIAGGCAMSIAGFIVILALAESVARIASRRRTTSSL